uniref:Uncharacterized protein n=1 Tax=viral metagenome TaxID=1070528 RepID=A0A6C0ECZ3_9ZZZZ
MQSAISDYEMNMYLDAFVSMNKYVSKNNSEQNFTPYQNKKKLKINKEKVKIYNALTMVYNELIDTDKEFKNKQYKTKYVAPHLLELPQQNIAQQVAQQQVSQHVAQQQVSQQVAQPLTQQFQKQDNVENFLAGICEAPGCNRHKRVGTPAQNYKYCAGDICGNRLLVSRGSGLLVRGGPGLLVRGGPGILVRDSPGLLIRDSPGLLFNGGPSLPYYGGYGVIAGLPIGKRLIF